MREAKKKRRNLCGKTIEREEKQEDRLRIQKTAVHAGSVLGAFRIVTLRLTLLLAQNEASLAVIAWRVPVQDDNLTAIF